MWRWIVLAFVLIGQGLCRAEQAKVADYAGRLAALQARLSAEPTNTAVLLALGDLCHDEGVNDNREAVKLADGYLTRLLSLEPTNATARALYGSTLTMKGRDAFWFPKRLSLVKSGIQEMDAAVRLATNDVKVRFTRANNNYFMPKFLERQEIVEADFAWLWQVVSTNTAIRDDFLRQTAALRQGQLLTKKKKVAEATPIWRKGLEFNPKSEVARDLQHELDRHQP